MPKKNCKLRYASRQVLLGEETERTMEVLGTWDFEKKSLKFKENISDDDNIIEVETTFLFLKDHIRVYRDGELTFSFDDKKMTETVYNTPYGPMKMTIKTKQSGHELSENRGTVYIEYDIYFDKEVKSDCTYGLKFEVDPTER